MKLFLCAAALAVCLIQPRCKADMLVVLNTHIYGEIDAPVSRPDGKGAGVGAFAQLFLVGKSGELTPLPPKTTFRTKSAKASFFVEPTQVSIPGIPNGGAVTLRLRVWEGSDYATAKLRGESIDIPLKNNAAAVNLTGLKGFKLTKPSGP
jgi:hypothetical protein